MAKTKFGQVDPEPVSESGFAYQERHRKGYVQGSADLPFGAVSGFLMKPEQTGMRHKLSTLGRKVRKGL